MVKRETGLQRGVKMKKRIVRKALDILAVALTEEDHIWTPEERGFYEDAIRQLDRRKKILRR